MKQKLLLLVAVLSYVLGAQALTIWHVEYRIFDGDNNLLDQKFYDKENEAKPVDYYYNAADPAYDEYAYYHDADFSQTWNPADANDLIPATGTTIVYVKKIKKLKYVSQPWKTLVLPIDINNLPDYFGEDYEGVPAVDVLEFQEVQNGKITSHDGEDLYSCNLIFNPVRAIVAYKPYLFRVNRVDESIIESIYSAEGQGPCKVTTIDDPTNAGISVSMEGTLEPNGFYMDATDGLHFYFGYNDRNETYNFYRVSANIPRNRCWFYVNDNRGYGAKLNVSFDIDGVTGIGQVMANTTTTNDKVYNLNGQQVAGKLQKGIYIANGKKVLVK